MSLVPAAKRQKTAGEIVASTATSGAIIASTRQRKSGLFSEVMVLSGHEGALSSLKFSPKGQVLATAGHDKTIYLWDVYGETPANFAVISGHKKDILELHWNADGNKLYTASADHSDVLGRGDAEQDQEAIGAHVACQQLLSCAVWARDAVLGVRRQNCEGVGSESARGDPHDSTQAPSHSRQLLAAGRLPAVR